ncbi:G2/M phase-specific E3 ubiquitin-protein ligase [Diretmus argenteus]
MSSGVYQRGEEDEGIFGFLGEDIKQEIRRSSRLTCYGCKKKGASVGCCIRSCRKMIHFPCGKKQQFISQFTDLFPSYCKDHSPTQSVSAGLDLSLPQSCSVCLDSIDPVLSYSVLKCPACHTSWFHRDCVQHQADSAGVFFFRCTLCNNKEHFQEEMLRMGIHIPERDASWELEENAFTELLEVYQQCDALTCLCDSGRTHSAKTGWFKMIRCQLCGSRGTHRKCSALAVDARDWACLECTEATDGKASLVASPQGGERRSLLSKRRLSSIHSSVSCKRPSLSVRSPEELLQALALQLTSSQTQTSVQTSPSTRSPIRASCLQSSTPEPQPSPLGPQLRPPSTAVEVGSGKVLSAGLALVRRTDFDPTHALSISGSSPDFCPNGKGPEAVHARVVEGRFLETEAAGREQHDLGGGMVVRAEGDHVSRVGVSMAEGPYLEVLQGLAVLDLWTQRVPTSSWISDTRVPTKTLYLHEVDWIHWMTVVESDHIDTSCKGRWSSSFSILPIWAPLRAAQSSSLGIDCCLLGATLERARHRVSDLKRQRRPSVISWALSLDWETQVSLLSAFASSGRSRMTSGSLLAHWQTSKPAMARKTHLVEHTFYITTDGGLLSSEAHHDSEERRGQSRTGQEMAVQVLLAHLEATIKHNSVLLIVFNVVVGKVEAVGLTGIQISHDDGALEGPAQRGLQSDGTSRWTLDNVLGFKEDLGQFPSCPSGSDAAKRYFLKLLVQQIKNSVVFEGPDWSKNLALDSQALREDLYFDVGCLLALSLVHGGLPIGFFSPALYQCLFNYPHNTPLTVTDMTDNTRFTHQVNEIAEATSLNELKKAMAASREYLELAGCKRRIRSLEERDALVEDLVSFTMITRMQLPLQRFREGLRTLGLFEQVQMFPSVFFSVFCEASDRLTAQTIDRLFTVHFSQQEERMDKETPVVSFWRHFLVECEVGRSSISLQDLLCFATGAVEVPATGLHPPPTLSFLYPLSTSPPGEEEEEEEGEKKTGHTGRDDGLFPQSDPNSNHLLLPVTTSYQAFKNSMEQAVSHHSHLFPTERWN